VISFSPACSTQPCKPMMHMVSFSLFSLSSTMPLTSIERGYTRDNDISKPSIGPTCSKHMPLCQQTSEGMSVAGEGAVLNYTEMVAIRSLELCQWPGCPCGNEGGPCKSSSSLAFAFLHKSEFAHVRVTIAYPIIEFIVNVFCCWEDCPPLRPEAGTLYDDSRVSNADILHACLKAGFQA